jgi:hypothetical protein
LNISKITFYLLFSSAAKRTWTSCQRCLPAYKKVIRSVASGSNRRDPSLSPISTISPPIDPECLSQPFGVLIVSADKHGLLAARGL